MPALWHDSHCPARACFFHKMASGHSSHCGLLYDLFLIASSEMEAYPRPSTSGRSWVYFSFFYLLSDMAEWQTALEIDSVPFAWREKCFLSKEVTSGCAGLLDSIKYSCYAQGREMHLVAAMGVKEALILFGFFSLNKGNLIFHYLSHAALKSVLWETVITEA